MDVLNGMGQNPTQNELKNLICSLHMQVVVPNAPQRHLGDALTQRGCVRRAKQSRRAPSGKKYHYEILEGQSREQQSNGIETFVDNHDLQ